MINKDFVPPTPEVSKFETEKRLEILNQVKALFSDACPIIFIGGSMATSQNFGVHPDSDIDTQLLVTPETVGFLRDTNFFDVDKLNHYINGYLAGHAVQFSLSGLIDGVTIECHFWDKAAYLKALTDHSEGVLRFRSSNTGSSVNHGFSFNGEENVTDYPTETIEGWFISHFPFFERRDNLFFPCRPLANLLATPIILQGETELQPYIDLLWKWIAIQFKAQAGEHPDLSTTNIINALPGNWKFSDTTRAILAKRTTNELSS